MIRYLPLLLVLAVWIYAFIDVLNTPENEVRKLPKLAWVFIVLLFGQVLIGPIAWFAAGRPRRNAPYGATRPQERRWVAPDDNPDFLKSLKDTGAAPTPDTPETPDTKDTPDASAAEDEQKPEQQSKPERNRNRDGRADGPEGDTPPPAGA